MLKKKKRKEIIKKLIPSDLEKYAEILESPSQIFEHLVIIRSGADSPAIGEPEVLGQLKDAYEKSLEKSWVSKFLTRAFERSINIAKRIREETEVQSGSLSIPGIVSLYLKDVAKDKKDFNCLVVGTGEMGIAISKYLYQEKIPFTIATRNEERAKFLKEHAKLESIVYTPETLYLYVTHFDAVIFATQTDKYLLKKEHLNKKETLRVIVDLGFPHNVDPQIKTLENIEFHQIDEFKRIIEERIKEKSMQLSYNRFHSAPFTLLSYLIEGNFRGIFPKPENLSIKILLNGMI